MGKAREAARAALSIPTSVCSVQTVAWLPVFGIFNLHADVDACDCTIRVLQTPEESLHGKLTLREKSLPASVLHLAFRSDAVPDELSCP